MSKTVPMKPDTFAFLRAVTAIPATKRPPRADLKRKATIAGLSAATYPLADERAKRQTPNAPADTDLFHSE